MAIEETPAQPQAQVRPGRLAFFGKVVNLSGSQAVKRAFRFLVMLIAARLLGPAAFGLYATLFTITEFVALLSGAGFGDLVTRETSVLPESARGLLFRLFLLRLFYVVLFSGIEIFVLRLLGYSPQVRGYALIFALTLPARSIAELLQGFIKSKERFHKLPQVELFQGIISVGVCGFLAYRNAFTLPALLWIEVASAAGGAVVTYGIAHTLLPGRHTSHGVDWQRVLKATVIFNVYPLIVNVYDRFDLILLSRLVSNVAAGLYAFPYRFVATFQIIPFGMTGVLFPGMARSHSEKEQTEMCRYLLTVLFFTSLIIVLLTFFYGDMVTRKLLSSAYQDAGKIFRILVWATIPSFLNYGLNTLLLSRRRERVFIWTAAICMMFNLAANFLLIPRFSYLAAAWVTVATEVLLLGQNFLILRRSAASVPIPRAMVRGLLVFVFVLFAANKLAAVVPETILGALSVLAFAAFSYGMVFFSRPHAAIAGTEN